MIRHSLFFFVIVSRDLLLPLLGPLWVTRVGGGGRVGRGGGLRPIDDGVIGASDSVQ